MRAFVFRIGERGPGAKLLVIQEVGEGQAKEVAEKKYPAEEIALVAQGGSEPGWIYESPSILGYHRL